MSVPPDPVLRAAVRWLELLPASDVRRCRALFASHAEFSDITPTQYETAYSWLGTAGLLDDLSSSVGPRRRVLTGAVGRGDVAWFTDMDVLVQGPDELPEDVSRAAASLGLTDDDAFAHISTVWGKVDTARREEVGGAGELELVSLLSTWTDARVDHVAATADGYGYDISVDSPVVSACLEVKSTTRRGRLSFYLSRNEYRAMCHNVGWYLVVVRLSREFELASVATVPREWISSNVPCDTSRHGRWESCRLDVPPGIAEPGIVPLAPALVADAPAVLIGAVPWPG